MSTQIQFKDRFLINFLRPNWLLSFENSVINNFLSTFIRKKTIIPNEIFRIAQEFKLFQNFDYVSKEAGDLLTSPFPS